MQLTFSTPSFPSCPNWKVTNDKGGKREKARGEAGGERWKERGRVAAAADSSAVAAAAAASFACCRVRVTVNTSRDFRRACWQHLTTSCTIVLLCYSPVPPSGYTLMPLVFQRRKNKYRNASGNVFKLRNLMEAGISFFLKLQGEKTLVSEAYLKKALNPDDIWPIALITL